jgi:hypothetical protein
MSTFTDDLLAFTVDVEWAHPAVLADLVRLFDGHGVRATFFCTHPGVEVPGHERGLHPNFRRNGDTLSRFPKVSGRTLADCTDDELHRFVLARTKEFAPEAVGLRSHSLYYDSSLMPLYRELGLHYDSSYMMPLEPGLRPVMKEFGVLELPVFYMDHQDLISDCADFRLEALRLDRPGLKVLDFHPNIVYVNAPDNDHYLRCKACYHDPDGLLRMRSDRRGARSLLLDLLEYAAARPGRTATLAEINAAWRQPR